MLKAGFARLDITPPFGTAISGYFYPRYTKGVLDDLELNALAVSDGETTALIIACDIIGIKFDKAELLRNKIEQDTGVKSNNILLCCLHQHTSFAIEKEQTLNSLSIHTPYFEVLYQKFADVAKMAIEDMREAKISVASGATDEQISFVRRYFTKNGPVATNPGWYNENVLRPAGEPDNTVRLVRFEREGNDIALVNFSTHPDVIGGEKVSADWPGFVRRYVEKDLEGVSCILVNGAQGDVNHFNFLGEKQKRSGYEHSNYMGRTIADTVLKLWNNTTERNADKIFADVSLIYSKTRTEGEERYDEMKKFYTAYEEDKLGYKPHITELATATRIISIRTETIYRPVPVSILVIGDVALVGFGGEPFTVYAKHARDAAPEKFVMAACCTNGYEGYLPSAIAFEEGGYESNNSLFTSAIEQEAADKVNELFKKARV